MPQYRESRTVRHRPGQMFDLVADIESYPRFVPGYTEARITARGGDTLTVEQRVGLGPARFRFISHAELARPAHIVIRSTDGPFDHLVVDWRFEPHGEGCRVLFEAAFRLNAGPLNRLVEAAFAESARRMVGAFLTRAQAIYGSDSC